MTYLSLVIPLYNEERCLENNYKRMKAFLDTQKKDYEIILVNDGSNDGTVSIIDEIIQTDRNVRFLSNPHNKGKGHAVNRGVLNTAGKYIVFTDADLAVPVHFVGRCLNALEAGSPVVIGSRHLPGSAFKVPQGFPRRFLGEVFRRFSRFCLGLQVSDITCGLKGFEKQAAFDIFFRSRIDRWGSDAEIIFLAQKLGYTLHEIPVEWSHSFESKVKVVSASIKTLAEVFKIFYFDRKKKYGIGKAGGP